MDQTEYYQRYYDYLESDWWRKTRDRIISMYGNKCFCCGDTVNLQVHHLSYEHIGFERDYELICLCVDCHAWIEKQKDDYKQSKGDTLPQDEQMKLLDLHKLELRKNQETIELSNSVASMMFIKDMVKNRCDLSAHGKLNLTNNDEIRQAFRKWCFEQNIKCERPAITMIQGFFRNRRYEVILKFVEGGWPQYLCHQRTLFSPSMISKVYNNPDGARRLLSIESNDNNINFKED